MDIIERRPEDPVLAFFMRLIIYGSYSSSFRHLPLVLGSIDLGVYRYDPLPFGYQTCRAKISHTDR